MAENTLALYIHWPFCKSKCPYCDFNSHVREKVPHDGWQDALIAEMEYFHSITPGRTITSIFFGGGTPSLMKAETAAALIERAETLWGFTDDIEITLEANPTSVEIESFRAFRLAGVNRVSIGVQALNAHDLKFLGRQHNADEARKAIEAARNIFDRYSFDLIYARPGQTLLGWRDELSEALTLAGGHISLYQLTIEPNTAFHTAYNKGEFELPEEEICALMYAITTVMLEQHGLARYEISNYAKPGEESRHNITYWEYGDYVGIGPGAHGRLVLADGTRIATQTAKHPETWLEMVQKQGHAIIEQEPLSFEEQVDECVMMSLRLTSGITHEMFMQRIGKRFEEVVSQRALSLLQNEHLLIVDEIGIRATPKGQMLLNQVISSLLVRE